MEGTCLSSIGWLVCNQWNGYNGFCMVSSLVQAVHPNMAHEDSNSRMAKHIVLRSPRNQLYVACQLEALNACVT